MTTPVLVTRRLAILLTAVMLTAFVFIGWMGERNSCLRQQAPRLAGNERKAAIDALVRASVGHLSPAARNDVLAKTKAVPVVPALRCDRIFPETN